MAEDHPGPFLPHRTRTWEGGSRRTDGGLSINPASRGSTDDMAVARRDVLFRFPGYVYTGQAQYDVSPDGERFAIVRGTVESQLIVALDMIRR